MSTSASAKASFAGDGVDPPYGDALRAGLCLQAVQEFGDRPRALPRPAAGGQQEPDLRVVRHRPAPRSGVL